jgi:hypothetical protein
MTKGFEAVLDALDCRGEFCRDQYRATQRLAQRLDTSDLVDGGADNCKVEPVDRSDVAIQHFPNVQREVTVTSGKPAAGARVLTAASSLIVSAAASSARREVSTRFPSLKGKVASMPSPRNLSTSLPRERRGAVKPSSMADTSCAANMRASSDRSASLSAISLSTAPAG